MEDIDGSFDISTDITAEALKCPWTVYTRLISDSSSDLPLTKMYSHGQGHLLLKDPDALNQVFGWEIRGQGRQTKPLTFIPIFGETSLFLKTGKDHARYRKQFRVPLSKKTLSNNQFYTKIASLECEKQLSNIMKASESQKDNNSNNNNNNIDFLDHTRSIAWNVGIKFLFGDNVISDELNKQLLELTLLIVSGLADHEYSKTQKIKIGGPMWIGLKAKEDYNTIISDIISKLELMYNNNELDENTALYQFFNETMLLKDSNPNEWNRNDFVLMLLVGALDTTSNSMCSLLYCIYKYPQQYNLLKEMLLVKN